MPILTNADLPGAMHGLQVLAAPAVSPSFAAKVGRMLRLVAELLDAAERLRAELSARSAGPDEEAAAYAELLRATVEIPYTITVSDLAAEDLKVPGNAVFALGDLFTE